MKNKTIATWLALLAGPFGMHRFYLHGWHDPFGWALPWPSLLGIYGVLRIRQFGVDDQLSWLLIPMLGFTIAGCALNAIIYGLTPAEKWQHKFSRSVDPLSGAGSTNWLTVVALVVAMLVGTTALMSSLAFSFQHLFEFLLRQGSAN